jgi:hypothetical protein
MFSQGKFQFGPIKRSKVEDAEATAAESAAPTAFY